MRRLGLKSLICGCALATIVSTPGAIAQTTAAETEEISSVFVFNRICYARVPNVQSIRDMATELAWLDLDQSELKEFETGGELEGEPTDLGALIGDLVSPGALLLGPGGDTLGQLPGRPEPVGAQQGAGQHQGQGADQDKGASSHGGRILLADTRLVPPPAAAY